MKMELQVSQFNIIHHLTENLCDRWFLFQIPMRIKGKERHRDGKSGKYTPTNTAAHQRIIGNVCRKKVGELNFEMIGKDSSVAVIIVQSIVPPQKWIKKNPNASLPFPCNEKPDWDNIGKTVSDAMNKIAYEDDKSIALATVIKQYDEVDKLTVIVGQIKEAKCEPKQQ